VENENMQQIGRESVIQGAARSEKNLKCDIIINIFIISIVLMEDDSEKCKIPLREWITVFFTISILRDLGKIYLKYLKEHPEY
jgi:hypothetical protein